MHTHTHTHTHTHNIYIYVYIICTYNVFVAVTAARLNMPVYEAFSYLCKRPSASGVRGLGPAGGECLLCDQVPHEQVFFTKQSKKKKKVWEDGVLVVKDGGSELQREDGATVTKSNKIKGPPDIGSLIFLGSFEVCVRETERERE